MGNQHSCHYLFGYSSSFQQVSGEEGGPPSWLDKRGTIINNLGTRFRNKAGPVRQGLPRVRWYRRSENTRWNFARERIETFAAVRTPPDPGTSESIPEFQIQEACLESFPSTSSFASFSYAWRRVRLALRCLAHSLHHHARKFHVEHKITLHLCTAAWLFVAMQALL